MAVAVIHATAALDKRDARYRIANNLNLRLDGLRCYKQVVIALCNLEINCNAINRTHPAVSRSPRLLLCPVLGIKRQSDLPFFIGPGANKQSAQY